MKIIVVIVALLGAGYVLHVQGFLEPKDRRPGLALAGEVASTPNNWRFTADHREILIETRTPYLLPHSVTIVCADAGGDLFVGARNPVGKLWVRWVERDPAVRLKIGDEIYEAELTRVTSPSELERVRAAYARKLGRPLENISETQETEAWYWRVDPRD